MNGLCDHLLGGDGGGTTENSLDKPAISEGLLFGLEAFLKPRGVMENEEEGDGREKTVHPAEGFHDSEDEGHSKDSAKKGIGKDAIGSGEGGRIGNEQNQKSTKHQFRGRVQRGHPCG